MNTRDVKETGITRATNVRLTDAPAKEKNTTLTTLDLMLILIGHVTRWRLVPRKPGTRPCQCWPGCKRNDIDDDEDGDDDDS